MGSPVDIGIDLGTTFSVIAAPGRLELSEEYGTGIYLDRCDVTIIPTPYGESTFPSVMVNDPVDPKTFLFGSDALGCIEDGSIPVMFSKRKIGTTETMQISSKTITAKDVAKSFLGYLKNCAEKALGSPVRRAVVTHPAYFDRAAVEETRQAAMEAGFDMENPDQMLMEPVAAALAYTRGDKRDPLRVITYDLGGGTFDVSCLERNDRLIEMRSFGGDHLLGGYNFDRVLVDWIRERLASRGIKIFLDEENPEDRSTIARLLQFTERAKIALAEAKEDDDPVQIRGRKVLMDKNGKEIPIDERITRKEFNSLIKLYLDRTIESTMSVIQKAGLEPNEIDIILLVGGSSRGRWVVDALKKAFPNILFELFEPDLCVAAGAALHAKMILPPLVQQQGSGLELLLDVPESMSIDYVTVYGRLRGIDASCHGMMALLSGDGLSEKRQASLEINGSFVFADIYLELLGINSFQLYITDSSGVVLVSHEFLIRYDPDSTETSSVVSVLPRTLLIETVDGMVAIADAGVSLPVICEQSYQRQNNNPNITLKLFQDRTPIGEIRVENIPKEGGIGSYVDLKLEVNERGQVNGNAVIRRTNGEIVMSAPVAIHIRPQEIPSKKDLERRLSELKSKWESISKQKNDAEKDLSKAVIDRLRHIENLYGQVPLERQEIAVAIDDLELIITPPKDVMQPTMAEFLKMVEKCREAFTKLDQFLRKKENEQRVDPRKATRIRRMHDQIKKRKKKMEQLLEDLEQRAKVAHGNRDRREWARINEATSSLIYEAQEKSKEKADKEETQPAFISKMMLVTEINELISRLNNNADELKKEGRFDDWHPEIRRIFSGLSLALKKATSISEEISGEKALAICRNIYANILNPLIRALDNIGVDISIVGNAVDNIDQYMNSTSFNKKMEDEFNIDGEIASNLLAAGHTSIFKAVLDDCTDVNQQDEYGHTPLMISALKGDIDLVSILLKKGALIDIRDDMGRTALMLAKNRQVAEKLVEAGSDVNTHDDKRVTALMLAVLNGETDLVKYLIENGADLEAQWEAGQTPLMIASYSGQLSIVDYLLSIGAKVDSECKQKRTSLHYAGEKGHTSIIDKLISFSGNIEKQDKKGYSPLFFSIIFEQIDAAERFLDKGANPNICRLEDDLTPLMMAASYGNFEILCTLLEKGASLNQKNNIGRTALMFSNNAQITEKLLDSGADVEAKDSRGVTALMIAAFEGNIDVAKTLITHRADIDSRWEAGQTSLIIASQAGHTNLVELLLTHGADINASCNYNRTAVHYASESSHFSSVIKLISYDANINIQDSAGDTPLFIALKNSNVKLVKLLLSINGKTPDIDVKKVGSDLNLNKGYQLITKGSYDEAFSFFQESLAVDQELFETDPTSLDKSINLILSHYNLSTVYKAQNNLDGMLNEFGKCIEIFDLLIERKSQLNKHIKQLNIFIEEFLSNGEFKYYNIEKKALDLYYEKKYNESFSLFKKQETICRANDNMDGLWRVLNNMASILRERDRDIKGSLTMHKEQESISREYHFDEGIALSLYNQAEIIFEELQKPEEALSKVRISFEIFNILGMEEKINIAKDLIERIEASLLS